MVIQNPDIFSFTLVTLPQFRQLLDKFGVPPIDRRWLAGPYLEKEYKAVQARAKELLSSGVYQLSTDCWKKNNVDDKRKLVGFTANVEFKKSMLVDIARVEDEKRATAEYLRELLERVICNVGSPKKCTGIISDREAAIQKALKNLEEKYPWMVNIPCQAHSLNLLVKDVLKVDPLLGWVMEMSRDILLLSNRTDVRPVVRGFQKIEYGTHKSLQLGVNTRFASHVRELRNVMESRKAFIRVPIDIEVFKKYTTDNTVASDVAAGFYAINNAVFWNAAEQALELFQPLADIIHQIEGDSPYISQVLRAWNQCGYQVRCWAEKYRRS